MAGTKSEMPGSIDKTPRHDAVTGWSSTAISYQRGEVDPPHHHIEGQLLFATTGVMLVETEGQRWVIPLSEPCGCHLFISTVTPFVANRSEGRLF